MESFSDGLGVEISLSLHLSTSAGSERGSQMTAVARRSYFTFSLAVKEDKVITVLEWQLGSEVKEAPKDGMCILPWLEWLCGYYVCVHM